MRIRSVAVVAVLALVGVAGVPTAAEAAPAPAAITGKVLSNGGEALKGMTVQAKSTKGVLYTTISDAKGRFYLTGLAAGTYGIKFSDRVGLYPCVEAPNCSAGPYLTTEWLGDATSFTASDKIRLTTGEKHTGVRALVDHYARLSGQVLLNGVKPHGSDGIVIDRLRNGHVVGGQLSTGRFFYDIDSPGEYRLRVRSYTNAFSPFYVTDPRDGNTVFHSDGIEKITGIPVNITIP